MAGIPQWLCTLQSPPLPSIGPIQWNPLSVSRPRPCERAAVCPVTPVHTAYSLLALAWMFLKLTPFLMGPRDFRLYADLLSSQLRPQCGQIPYMTDRLGNVRLVRNTSCPRRVSVGFFFLLLSAWRGGISWARRPRPQCVGGCWHKVRPFMVWPGLPYHAED